jgi:hypothetical protein
MDIFAVPRREVAARILLDDGRTVHGSVYLAVAGLDGRPETVAERLNDPSEEFVPVASGSDRFLLNKSGILTVHVPVAGEAVHDMDGGREAPVRISLAGGIGLLGSLHIAMPAERSRVLDYLNAAPRFLPLRSHEGVTLVHRRFIVSVRSED